MIRNILAPTDLSPASLAAVRYACGLATSIGARLHVMHVLENPISSATFGDIFTALPPDCFADIEQSAQETLRGCLTEDEKRQVNVVMTTQPGFPTEEILRRLDEEPGVDLVVMSTHGRGGVARLVMGSVADKVIRSAPCPVLTMRESPVQATAAESVASEQLATCAD